MMVLLALVIVMIGAVMIGAVIQGQYVMAAACWVGFGAVWFVLRLTD